MDTTAYPKMLRSVQRRVALRICRAYRTVSAEASLVIASLIPIHLLVRERLRTWECDEDRGAASRVERDRTLNSWQEEWRNSTKGAWTRSLIPDVRRWVVRKHGETGYYLTQALSGHGSFRTYLHKIGKSESDYCVYCGEVDNAEHTLFTCVRWANLREITERKIGGIALSRANFIDCMLEEEGNWRAIEEMVSSILAIKEKDER